MATQNVVLGTSETTIIQPSAGLTFAVTSITFCNTSASDVNVTIYRYPLGSSASNGTTIMKTLIIPTGDTFVWEYKALLAPLDKVSGLASAAASITVTSDYLDIT